MSRSGKLGFKKYALAASAGLLASLAVACSRPMGLGSDDAVSSGQRQAPFQAATSSADPKAEMPDSDDQDGHLKSESDLPFRDRLDLPAGTLLTVRLNNAIAADSPGPSESFQAILDEPIQIKGNILLLRGASVAGRIEAARTSEIKRNHGYVRLTLNAIRLEGRDVPLQTASLFVHGATQNQQFELKGSPIGLQRGRRLTFRLTEPVILSNALPAR